MAVLIRDMDMPQSCAECRFCVDNWCYVVPPEQRQPAVSISGKTCWCPLVEVKSSNLSSDDLRLLVEAGFE